MKFKLFVWICSIAFPFRTCSPFYSFAHYNIIIRFCHYTAGIKNRAQATGGAGARGLQFWPGCSEAIDPEWRLPGSTLAGRCFSSYDMSAKRSERDLNTRPLSRITGFQGLPISSCGITAQYPGRESNPQALKHMVLKHARLPNSHLGRSTGEGIRTLKTLCLRQGRIPFRHSCMNAPGEIRTHNGSLSGAGP